VQAGSLHHKFAGGRRSDAEEDGVFILDSAFDFATGSGVAEADDLTGGAVFQDFDAEDEAESAVFETGVGGLAAPDDGAEAEVALVESGAGGEVLGEFEAGFGTGEVGERFAEGEDIPAFAGEGGGLEGMAAAEGGAVDPDVAPDAELEEDLPGASAFVAGEEFEADEEEGAEAARRDVEEAEGKGFIRDLDGGPGAGEAEVEVAAVSHPARLEGGEEEVADFGFAEGAGAAGDADAVGARPVGDGETEIGVGEELLDAGAGEDEGGTGGGGREKADVRQGTAVGVPGDLRKEDALAIHLGFGEKHRSRKAGDRGWVGENPSQGDEQDGEGVGGTHGGIYRRRLALRRKFSSAAWMDLEFTS
jgi:hypothetical protein